MVTFSDRADEKVILYCIIPILWVCNTRHAQFTEKRPVFNITHKCQLF